MLKSLNDRGAFTEKEAYKEKLSLSLSRSKSPYLSDNRKRLRGWRIVATDYSLRLRFSTIKLRFEFWREGTTQSIKQVHV